MTRKARGCRALGAFVALPLLLALAGSAQAATLTRDGTNRVFWNTEGPTTNQVVDYWVATEPSGAAINHSFIFHTENTTVAAAGCSPAGTVLAGTTVTCPLDIPGIWFNLWNGNDLVRLRECSGSDCSSQTAPTVPVQIDGFAGNDNLATFGGNDIVSGNSGEDAINTGLGNDQLDVAGSAGTPHSGSDSLAAGPGDDTVIGGDGNDTVDAGDGADSINPGIGDDVITPGTGDDGDIDGGDGGDTVRYNDGRTQRVMVTLNAAGAPGDPQNDGGLDDNATPGERENLMRFENVVGSPLGDDLTGTGAANLLEGLGGDDVLDGLDQQDEVLGGDGDDTIRGGPDTDTLDGGDGRDTVSYGDRAAGEQVNLSADNADNDGVAGENDVLGTTFEVFSGGAGNDTISATIAGAELRGAGGNDVLLASNSGHRLFGEDGSDRLFGFDGADLLDGGNDSDELSGGAGEDSYFGGEADDNVQAQDGVAEEVDCGGGDDDFARTDDNDIRTACELPAPPPPPPPMIIPPPPPVQLRTPAVQVRYKLLRDPTRTTNFLRLQVKSVPPGSNVIGRCLTNNNKPCKGKLRRGFTKSDARGTIRVRRFEKKNYPAGSKLEFVITNPAFVTQYKIVRVVRNNDPVIVTRCSQPGTTRRGAC